MESVMPARPEVTGRRPADAGNSVGETAANAIPEFCRKHGFSVSFYYKLRAQGLGPAEIHLGSRVIITNESAAAWRRTREAATAAQLADEADHILGLADREHSGGRGAV
jgi:hypothetical protein